MPIWFPIMLCDDPIGEVHISRCEPLGENTRGDYVYSWTVEKFQQGTTKKAPEVTSGAVMHTRSDGPFELVRKVLNAACAQAG
jgi:hypothetical protein